MAKFVLRTGALVLAAAGVFIWACAGRGDAQADAVPTRVMVRVISRDAKVMGSGVGGARVRITDATTGEVLAEGKHEGGTGDTKLIMTTPRRRGMALYTSEGTAGFLAELQLTKPTVVNIEAMGPMGFPQATHSATKQMLLVPGRHVEGDGVVLELHGFIVEILEPEPLTPVDEAFRVLARVRMMCGCPIEPGGLWDADTKEFTARLRSGGAVVATARLEYAGEVSHFRGTVSVPEVAREGELTLEVVVADPREENFGRHEIPLGG